MLIKKAIPVILIQKFKEYPGLTEYKRYLSGKCTNHIRSDPPLTSEEVELFRRNPVQFLYGSDILPTDPIEPQTA
jgi:hypothetical protein